MTSRRPHPICLITDPRRIAINALPEAEADQPRMLKITDSNFYRNEAFAAAGIMPANQRVTATDELATMTHERATSQIAGEDAAAAPPATGPASDASAHDPAEAVPETSFSGEVWRKALHLLALVIPAGMAYLETSHALAVLLPATLLCLAIDFARAYMPRFAGLIDRFFGFMMRPEERGSALQSPGDETSAPNNDAPAADAADAPESTRKTPVAPQLTGATWMMLSATVLTMLFPRDIAVFALGMFMICDAAAALVGKRFGRFHWFGGRRTLEGSLAFFVTGCVVAACFPGRSLAVAMAAVVVATLAEIPQRPLNDNLRLPLVAAALMLALYALLGLG